MMNAIPNAMRLCTIRRNIAPMLLAVVLGTSVMSGARAALTINAAGIAAGFSLSTFYSDPATQYGVLSLANGPDGFVYAAGYARSELYKFNNVDGQSYGSEVLKVTSIVPNPTGMAAVGGQVYTGLVGGALYKVDSALGLTALAIDPAISFAYGLWGNQTNGHLLASTFNHGLIDINPTTLGWVQIGPAGEFVDGVTVSPDGKIAYAAYSGAIRGYRLDVPDPGTAVLNSLSGHGPDGTGVISGGVYNGDIIVDNNDGTLGLIDHLTGIETTIAEGGSRGDLVSADLTTGTLFITQYESVLRLSCGSGCAIGSTTHVPEPMTLALFGAALAGLAATRRRKSIA